MKERRTFIGKVKQVDEQHANTIETTILVVLVIGLFIAGFLVSWKLFYKPLSTNQFEACEQVARDVYAQNGIIIGEVPEDFAVSITTKTIKVRLADQTYQGEVIAKLQKGELVMVRDMEVEKPMSTGILIGLLFNLVPFSIVIHSSFNEKVNK